MFAETIKYAYNNSSFYNWFYTHHDIDVFSDEIIKDYAQIPILRKQDILFFLKKQEIDNIWCQSTDIITLTTTGTTSKRFIVPYTENDIFRFTTMHIIDALKWWGRKDGPINSLLFGHRQDLASILLEDIAKSTEGITYQYIKIKGRLDSIDKPVEETITFIPSLSALSSMLSSPSYMSLFKKLNVKYILTLVTPPELKSKFHIKIKAKLGNIELIPVYGSVEMGLVGVSCPHIFESTYIHVMQQSMFHILHQDLTLGDYGIGKLVYTSLNREAFPFINYEVGDNVILKERQGLCNCGFSNKIMRFENRHSLTVKIPDAGGYFIDVLKVDEIIKNTITGSHMICIYGEHVSEYFLFLAIFIGVGGDIFVSEDKVKEMIVKEIILNHFHPYKIEEEGLYSLVSQFKKNFPIFIINSLDIPKEPGANKPRILLNLMQDGNFLDSEIYQQLIAKLDDYLV